jgi:hypothetical protein
MHPAYHKENAALASGAAVKRRARFGTPAGGYFEINVRFDETISASSALSLWLLEPLIANNNL